MGFTLEKWGLPGKTHGIKLGIIGLIWEKLDFNWEKMDLPAETWDLPGIELTLYGEKWDLPGVY